jgi:hypothetical protein
MFLRPHQTKCPACDRFVYATDALFVAENWKGVEKIPGFVPGIYHDACFQNSRHREAYLSIARAVRNAELDQADEYVIVLGRTKSLALVLRPLGEDYQLSFLTRGRTLRLRGSERWKEFLSRITAVELAPTVTAGDRGPVRVRQTQAGWELATRQSVAIVAELSQVNFERVRQHLTSRGIDPTVTAVPLGAVCSELRIVPKSVGCPLDRLTGTFAWPEPSSTDGELVTVQVETWHSITVTGEEFDELRRFLGELGRDQRKQA